MKTMRKLLPYWLIMPAIGVIIVVSIYPLIYSINMALHSWNLTRPQYGYNFVGIQNFVDIFLKDNYFWNSLRVQFTFSAGAVLGEVLFGLALALLLSISIKGQTIIRSLILMPMLLAYVVVGLIWKYFLNPSFGVLNAILPYVGISPQDWFGSPSMALWTLIVIDIWQWTPFVFLIFVAAVVSLPKGPFEVASVEGANGWQKFIHITLPLMKPIIILVVLLRIIDTFKEFDKIYILTMGGPSNSTEVYSIYAYRQGFKFFNIGYAAALSWILLIVVLIICTILVRVLQAQKAGEVT